MTPQPLRTARRVGFADWTDLDTPKQTRTWGKTEAEPPVPSWSAVLLSSAVASDVDQRTARVPRIGATLEQRLCRTCAIVLAIVVGLVAIVALWLFGAWLASEVLLH